MSEGIHQKKKSRRRSFEDSMRVGRGGVLVGDVPAGCIRDIYWSSPIIIPISDEQTALLERELTAIIDGDRYFLSPRIQTLREIRNMIRPEPVRESLPRAEALRAAPKGPIPKKRLGEVRTPPADDPRERGGCSGAVHRLAQGVPPSSRARSRGNGATIRPRDSRSRLA
jgi:hypothetical protein